MVKILVWVFNHRFYPVLVGVVFVLAAVLLARDGVEWYDVAALAGVGVVSVGIWLLLRPQQSGPNSVQAIRALIKDGTQPTLIEFYSSYCVGCMAIQPVVDQLAKEAGERLRILRLSIDTEPGKTLMQEHKVVFTPTFVYYDARGNKVRDSVFVLDKAKILYDLEHA